MCRLFFSDEKPVLSGASQGTILGSLLFIFYISDSPDFCKIENVSIKLYADLKSYIVHKNEPQKLASLQIFIDKLSICCLENDLKLQPSKCYCLYIGGAKNKRHQYILNNHPLQPKSVVRDLGIQMSSDLKWTPHVKGTMYALKILKNRFSCQ